MKLRPMSLLLLASLGAIAASAGAACLANGEVRQICGVQSPEDMELLPGGSDILISEMAGEKNQPGKFAVMQLASEALTELKPEGAAANDWGDPACRQRTPDQISPHGFHLSRQSDGRWLLLAVNHGEQESVQAYDVARAGGQWRLQWRGCVDTRFNFNDLAATPDGFIGAHQYDKKMGEGADAEKFLFGGGMTGYAVRWSRAAGFRKIPGTEAAYPNGITVSADGKSAWLAATAGPRILKIDLLRNTRVASARLPLYPDNLSWTADGKLLVTGTLDVHRLVRCADHNRDCPVPFAVARIDPVTLKSSVIFRNDGQLLLGASVAIIG